jgi:hypothetical protein
VLVELVAVEAGRDTAGARGIIPIATAEHPVRACTDTPRIAARRGSVVAARIPVPTPLAHVTRHVIQPVSIRREAPHRRGVGYPVARVSCAGEKVSVDPIVPRAVAPELDNVMASALGGLR